MAWLVALRRTRRSVGDGDDILEAEHHSLGIDAREGHVHDVREHTVRVSVELWLERFKGSQDTSPVPAASGNSRGCFLQRQSRRLSQTDDQGDGKGPRTQTSFLSAS